MISPPRTLFHSVFAVNVKHPPIGPGMIPPAGKILVQVLFCPVATAVCISTSI